MAVNKYGRRYTRGRRLDPAERDRILDLASTGQKRSAIAIAVQVAESTVYKYIKLSKPSTSTGVSKKRSVSFVVDVIV